MQLWFNNMWFFFFFKVLLYLFIHFFNEHKQLFICIANNCNRKRGRHWTYLDAVKKIFAIQKLHSATLSIWIRWLVHRSDQCQDFNVACSQSQICLSTTALGGGLHCTKSHSNQRQSWQHCWNIVESDLFCTFFFFSPPFSSTWCVPCGRVSCKAASRTLYVLSCAVCSHPMSSTPAGLWMLWPPSTSPWTNIFFFFNTQINNDRFSIFFF